MSEADWDPGPLAQVRSCTARVRAHYVSIDFAKLWICQQAPNAIVSPVRYDMSPSTCSLPLTLCPCNAYGMEFLRGMDSTDNVRIV